MISRCHRSTSLVFLLILCLSMAGATTYHPPERGKSPQANVLIFQIRGMTYEMLERAYTPNMKYLIKNGFLGSLKYKNPEEQAGTGRRESVRRKLGNMARCMDTLHSGQYSMNTVGIFNDTITGPFSRIRNNYRSNESMVKDFINNNNGTNVRLVFLSFRRFSTKTSFLTREQISELTTIDSLIGVVFKSYQEKEKWEQTSVFIITDGTACHQYQPTELYKNTPIIIKDAGIPAVRNVENLIKIDDILQLAASRLGLNCKDIGLRDSSDYFSHLLAGDSTEVYNSVFVSRPDILAYPIVGKNLLEVDVLTDHENSRVYYSTDSLDPRISGIEYKGPFYLKDPGMYLIKAASNYNGIWSSVTQQSVTLRHDIASIELSPQPDPKYTFNGADELIDGDTANLSFMADKWLGFQGKDVNMFFDFGNKREIKSIDMSALQDYVSWIFLPKKVTFFVGNDRNHMVEIGSVMHHSGQFDVKNLRKHYRVDISDALLKTLGRNMVKKRKRHKTLYVKYLLIQINAQKIAPDWFSLPGAQVWFFTDEVSIQ
ncbi:MAG: hypothetical protein J5I59_06340 [Saprospiraceae bacterium]|nr:hypothetical protein [Saprospiraceae bacterium]